MKYTSEKIEAARSQIAETEQRIKTQNRRIEKLLVERHPADEAQALLLIMEQSLGSMKRFLALLERDLETELSLHQHQVKKRSQKANPTV
jgi:hypothetical protein